MIPIILMFIVGVIVVKAIKYHQNDKLGWKAVKKDHKLIVYSEKIIDEWHHIYIDAHFNIGTFEPLFKSENEWKSYPDWAQNRSRIIKRVSREFPLKS